MSLAQNEPKKLPDLLKDPVRKKRITNEDIPMGPVRIPKRKKKVDSGS